jgi:hypothetical protein
MSRREIKRDVEIVKGDLFPPKARTFPGNKDAPRGTDRREEIKTIKAIRIELSQETDVKALLFCFLQTKDVITTLQDLVSHSIPFPFSINASDIP